MADWATALPRNIRSRYRNDSSGYITSITAVASTNGTIAIVATPNPITATGTIKLADTDVEPGTYANATVTVDKQGRLTNVVAGAIADAVVMDNSAVTKYPDAPQTNGVWYGTGTKAAANTSNTNTLIGNGITGAATTNLTAVGYLATASAAGATAVGKSATASGFDATAVGHLCSAGNLCLAAGNQSTATDGTALFGSVALGYRCSAVFKAVAMGMFSTAGGSSIAIGNTATASSTDSVVIGSAAASNATRAVTIGILSAANAANAVAIGNQAGASVADSIAIGYLAAASTAGTGNIAIGKSAVASAAGATAIGESAVANVTDAIAIGKTATSSGANRSIAIGSISTASSQRAVAIGASSTASITESVAIGGFASAITSGSGNIAIGGSSNASGDRSTVLGYQATANRPQGIAIGNVATVSSSGTSNIAIGTSSTASADRAIAIGDTATASVANSIGIGQNVTVNNTAYALGFGINTASVVPGYVGVNLNNATFQVPKYTTLYTTTATAAGTTTLTVTSARDQFFTGATTQTVVLPVTSTLALGFAFNIVNDSTGVVTVQSSGANTVVTLSSGVRAIATCILTSGTTAASWSVSNSSSSAVSGVPYSIDGSVNGATGAVFTGTATTAGSVASMSYRYQKMPFNGGVLNHLWVEWLISNTNITGAGSLIGDVPTSVFGASYSAMTDYLSEGGNPSINCSGTPVNTLSGTDSVLNKNYSGTQSFTSATNLTFTVNYIPANPSDDIRFTPAIFTWMTAS